MAARPARKGIKDVFYETRVVMGRDYTFRRFATEVLGNTVSPLLLGYIEKGKRLPSEGLVRRLAAVRKQDPQELLALLWRDRMLYAFGSELRRVLRAPEGHRRHRGRRSRGAGQPGDCRAAGRRQPGSRSPAGGGVPRRAGAPQAPAPVSPALAKQVEAALKDRQLVEVSGGKVRRLGHHFLPQNGGAARAGARVLRPVRQGPARQAGAAHVDTGTYLRNHLRLCRSARPARDPEAVRRGGARRSLKSSPTIRPATARFLNMLITSTPF